MKYSQCGYEITNGQGFCSSCGTPAPTRPQKKPFPWKLVLCVALALSLMANAALLFLAPEPSDKIEGSGYSSPEAAIVAYAEALQNGDVEQMLSTFAVESYVECFDLEAYIDKYTTVLFDSIGLILPNHGEFKESINSLSRLAAITNDLRRSYYHLIDFDVSRPVIFSGENKETQIADTLKQLKSSGFENELSLIKIGDVLTKKDFDINSEHYELMLDNYTYLDVDKLRDVAIEIEFDGEDYYLFMLTAEINGKWYNITTLSPLGTLLGLDSISGGFLKQ